MDRRLFLPRGYADERKSAGSEKKPRPLLMSARFLIRFHPRKRTIELANETPNDRKLTVSFTFRRAKIFFLPSVFQQQPSGNCAETTSKRQKTSPSK